MSELADKIVVVIRKRPLGKREIQKKEEDIVDVNGESSVIVKEVKYSYLSTIDKKLISQNIQKSICSILIQHLIKILQMNKCIQVLLDQSLKQHSIEQESHVLLTVRLEVVKHILCWVIQNVKYLGCTYQLLMTYFL